jgi:transposase
MVHVGLDLSRRRLGVCVLAQAGPVLMRTAVSPDSDGLEGLVRQVAAVAGGVPVSAAIESMSGSRAVRDHLVECGWRVQVADAAKAKGLAPLTCKTDRIDAWVLAELSRRDLVPQVWLPDPVTRSVRERARFRLHLVGHRTALKNRVHAALIAFGYPCPVSDLFGDGGRRLLQRLALQAAWRDDVAASLQLIDHLDAQIDQVEAELRAEIAGQTRYARAVQLLQSVPGIGPVLAVTIASELGEITRFATAKQLVGYTGLCPRVYQSGQRDRRGPLTKNGPKYLRWALIEAAVHAASHPLYREHYQATKQRLGKQRGPKVARVDVARRLAEAIWWMLTTDSPFSPAGASADLAA